MMNHGLSLRQVEILRGVLSLLSHRFDRVGLFGSRATGRARPASDIDLVIYGAKDPQLADTLFTLFGESGLPMTVDVVDYDRIDEPSFRQQIDAVAQPLFAAIELGGRPQAAD